MKNSKILKAYLVVAGALLIFFGIATLSMPLELKGAFDINIPRDMNVLNDVRAYAALSLSLGVLAILGAFVPRLTYTSSLVVFVQFLALGLGRLVSMLLDGVPVDGNIIGMGNEFFLGIVGATVFVKHLKKGAAPDCAD